MQARALSTDAVKAAEQGSRREARAWREASADVALLRQRTCKVLEALRAAARLSLKCAAAMQAAANTTNALQAQALTGAKPAPAQRASVCG